MIEEFEVYKRPQAIENEERSEEKDETTANCRESLVSQQAFV